MTTRKKNVLIGFTVAVYLVVLAFVFIVARQDRIYAEANPAVPMVFEVDGFGALMLSDQATMTMTSAEPFRIETKDGPVDSTFLDASHFQIGPIDVEGKVTMIYGDGRIGILLVHSRSLTVTGTDVTDDWTSATVFILVYGAIIVMVIVMVINQRPTKGN